MYSNVDVEISVMFQDLGWAPWLWWEFLIKYQDCVFMGFDGSLSRGVDEFWILHWCYFEIYDEYFYYSVQIWMFGGSLGYGCWNISGIGLPDPVLCKIYYQNAFRYLPLLRLFIEKQLVGR